MTDLEQKHQDAINRIAELSDQLEVALAALESIKTYTFRSPGPAGCDSHGITHPCGPCFGFANEKLVAKTALKTIKEMQSEEAAWRGEKKLFKKEK